MSFRVFAAALWVASVLVLLAIVVAAAIGGVKSIFFIGPILAEENSVEQYTSIVILSVFGWVLVELAIRGWLVRRQHKAISTFEMLLDDRLSDSSYEPRAYDSARPRAINRADLIIESNRAGHIASVHDSLPAAAAFDGGKLNASYSALNVYAWILPVLGFIGTASGMAAAIDGFKNVIEGGANEKLREELSQSVIPGLAGAFGITIVALAAALVAYLCTNALRSWDQEALDELDRLCMLLLYRIPKPPSADAEMMGKILAVLEQTFAKVHGIFVQTQGAAEGVEALRSTATTINAASVGFESIVKQIHAAAQEAGQAAGAMTAATTEAESTIAALGSSVKELTRAVGEFQRTVEAPIHITATRVER